MREILYRGKRLDNGEWVHGDLLRAKNYLTNTTQYFLFHNAEAFPASEFDGWEEVDPATVGQYTGLTDKAETRIFEGDVISYEDDAPGQVEYHDSTVINRGEIKFSEGEFYFTNAVAVCMDDLRMGDGVLDCKVIGNIHDNQELLEEHKNED